MVILAPANGTRALLPPDPTPIQLTQAQILRRNAAAMKQAKALSWTRAANARAAAFAPKNGATGVTAGGARKNTTPPRPVAVALPPPTLPPPSIPPPSIPPPIAKIPKLPPLPPLPPPPLPPSAPRAPGTAAGGGGLPSPTAVAAGGGGILLMIGLALLASFGRR